MLGGGEFLPFNGDGSEMGGGAHGLEFVPGGDAARLAAVEREGAENVAVRPGNGQGTARVQSVAQRGIAPGTPVVVDGDVGGDDQAAGAASRPGARVGPGADGQAVDERVVFRGEVGGRADAQAAAVGVE